MKKIASVRLTRGDELVDIRLINNSEIGNVFQVHGYSFHKCIKIKKEVIVTLPNDYSTLDAVCYYENRVNEKLEKGYRYSVDVDYLGE